MITIFLSILTIIGNEISIKFFGVRPPFWFELAPFLFLVFGVFTVLSGWFFALFDVEFGELEIYGLLFMILMWIIQAITIIFGILLLVNLFSKDK